MEKKEEEKQAFAFLNIPSYIAVSDFPIRFRQKPQNYVQQLN
jgi:hypothetical protein